MGKLWLGVARGIALPRFVTRAILPAGRGIDGPEK